MKETGVTLHTETQQHHSGTAAGVSLDYHACQFFLPFVEML